MKIGVIGLGDIAEKAHLPVLTQLSDIELVFCTRNAERVAQLAAKYRVSETCTDYRQLLTFDIDAVMIHSATFSHFEIAHFFLSQGLPVFVDKPLSDNYADCEILHELAEIKSLPLFMGFNRRYIPLFNKSMPNYQIGNETEQPLLSLRWEKHRHNLTGDVRTFVFDDYIHPLDSVNIDATVKAEDLHIIRQFDGDQLARLDVQWQNKQTMYHASMHRLHGCTQEIVTANYRNQTFQFDSFVTGKQWVGGVESRVQSPDWTPMLATKGFHAMHEHWASVVESGKQDSQLTARNLHSHYLCEQICQRLTR
ncbi:Gfo/Idh/MocA family protein [Photobacterium sanguinicancri]|uniref:Gfo/Idh/MocA family protein n=1 Tax=Photobacterium sanguinicancri TaxID=875932 RepID=UPI0026E24191|nr:Gfo/Idh/MocA family oxidoreductase [Photobacterium sanguinicancri]MDO6496690.1 Gfo/Idh/MocA family oxidoreductase [Photobacterium sanguinicancri]